MKYYIYRIINLTNGKSYIGQHATEKLNDGYFGSGVLIMKAVNKYGKSHFRKDYLKFCNNKDELNEWEKTYIMLERLMCGGEYNVSDGGSNYIMPIGVYHFNKDRKHTDLSKLHMSKAHVGKKLSKEHRNKIGQNNVGKHNWSEEAKAKMSEVRKGWCPSIEVRKHMSDSQKVAILCVETNTIWPSAKEASLYYGKSATAVEACMRDGHALNGKYHFKRITPKKFRKGKKVLCVETNEIFSSVDEAALKYKLNKSNLANCARGLVPRCGKLHWKYI